MASQVDSILYRDFPSTIGLSREDLEELLGRPEHQQQAQQRAAQQGLDASDAYLEAFVDSLPEVRALFDEHARLLKESEAKAARNLALQPGLEALRAETQHYHDRAVAAEQQWPRAEAEMKEAYKRFAPSSMHSQLVHDASRLHQQSEALASAFVDGLPLDIEGTTPNVRIEHALFTKRYREMRTEYHKLNLIAERWASGTVQWE
ncbi:hypothetical protein BCV69DRAFT_251465 [Microstroma glucosiphilum]|uniref:VPS37 C-terminal domain-containing protein n=1 Tax=Pseudomicrostroma glucosiphilum TaxID=1684307 RepID=A0A316U170_9BASI|nr:hypothetical protein BCV69DRAFT_251465 [Pseudomicrostroma glucosiphilum]PWN19136.1 hypothetical protein BCV69DRAFT_251465 [Pseudomicrostroma glucosiphilum]